MGAAPIEAGPDSPARGFAGFFAPEAAPGEKSKPTKRKLVNSLCVFVLVANPSLFMGREHDSRQRRGSCNAQSVSNQPPVMFDCDKRRWRSHRILELSLRD
jgi:hypothetical protein